MKISFRKYIQLAYELLATLNLGFALGYNNIMNLLICKIDNKNISNTSYAEVFKFILCNVILTIAFFAHFAFLIRM